MCIMHFFNLNKNICNIRIKIGKMQKLQYNKDDTVTAPDSSSGRASASGAGGRRFETRPRHTKGVKNGTSGYLAWRSVL